MPVLLFSLHCSLITGWITCWRFLKPEAKAFSSRRGSLWEIEYWEWEGARWTMGRGNSLLSFSFPAFPVHFHFSLSPAAARKTIEASAEEKLRSRQDESNFRA